MVLWSLTELNTFSREQQKKQLDNCIVFIFTLKLMAAFILKWSQYQVIQYTQASDNVFYIIQRINSITQYILQYLVSINLFANTNEERLTKQYRAT